MPNSRHTSDMLSPSSRRPTKRRSSSITELAFHGINTSRQKAKSVTHVSGTKCHLCLRPHTHLRTRFTGGLSGKDSAFKHVLAAFDANEAIVHLDGLDEGLQVGLSERHRTRGELLAHAAAEALNECRINADC